MTPHIWDVSPGYLGRQALLAEHRALHRLHAREMAGAPAHTRSADARWQACRSGRAARHAVVAAEMRLRGLACQTPLARTGGRVRWPGSFIETPAEQLARLAAEGATDAPRIPPPRLAQELWAHHKYSVLARDPGRYRALGRRVAALRRGAPFDDLALELTLALRTRPDRGRRENALQHMWGYVSDAATDEERRLASGGGPALLRAIQAAALRQRQPYLLASTALSDLDA